MNEKLGSCKVDRIVCAKGISVIGHEVVEVMSIQLLLLLLLLSRIVSSVAFRIKVLMSVFLTFHSTMKTSIQNMNVEI